jgi:hypothetical protein
VSFHWRPTSWKKERRFIVRRDPAEAGEQLTLEGREWHYSAIATNDSERSADELERCRHGGGRDVARTAPHLGDRSVTHVSLLTAARFRRSVPGLDRGCAGWLSSL